MPFSAGALTGNSQASPVYPVYGTETNEVLAADYNNHVSEVRKIYDYIRAGDSRVAYLRRRYGAGGQGSSDDRQALIDALANDGSKSIIVLEPGTYYVSGGVTVGANKVLVAQFPIRTAIGGRGGHGGSYFWAESNSVTTLITDQDVTLLDMVDARGLYGLHIVSEDRTKAILVNLRGTGVDGDYNDDGFMANCWLANAKKGLVCTNVQGWEFRGMGFDGFSGNACEFVASSNNWLVNSRVFYALGGCGVVVKGGSWHTKILGNFIDNNSSYYFGENPGTVGPSRAGVRVEDATHTHIEGNTFNQNYIQVSVDHTSGGEHTHIGPNVMAGSFAESIYLNNVTKCVIAAQDYSNRHPANEGGSGFVTSSAHIKTNGTCSRIWIGGGVMSGDAKKAKGVSLSAGTTKSYVGQLIVDGIATPIEDLNGTNTVATVIT